jgi:hypothetical protein
MTRSVSRRTATTNMERPPESDDSARAAGDEIKTPLLVAEFSAGELEPDGNLEKSLWAGAEWIGFDMDAFSRVRYPRTETKVAACWAPEFLYLGFLCRYETLMSGDEDSRAERWRLWERDVIEAFINPNPLQPSHYYEFEVAPNNQWLDLEIDLRRKPIWDRRWDSGFHHATRIDATCSVWTAEMRIPIASMKRAVIRPGIAWSVNFYRCEGAGKARRMLSWGALPLSLSESSFHQPDSFGTLKFVTGRAG